MLARDGHPTPLGQALAAYGRIAETLHLLTMVDPVEDQLGALGLVLNSVIRG